MDPTNRCESEFDFALVLDGIDELTDDVMDSLFEAGCDDATPSRRLGRVYLTFSRMAPTMWDAVLSAIGNVRGAGIGADVLRVDVCNLVTQADIARKIGRSRQVVSQYVSGARGPGGFPAPACGDISEGNTLWYWCEVAYWLWENGMVREEVATEAEEAAAINSVLEVQYHERRGLVRTAELYRSIGGSQAVSPCV